MRQIEKVRRIAEMKRLGRITVLVVLAFALVARRNAEALEARSSGGGGGGGDLNPVATARATYGVFIPTTSGVAANHIWGNYIPTKNSHVRKIDIWADTAGVTCSTAPNLAVYEAGSVQGGTGTNLANTTQAFDASSLNIAVAAGTALQVGLFTAAVGCGTFPANITVTMEITTD
jgi:hypothetical protein